MRNRQALWGALSIVVVCALGCSKPEPPVLTPRTASFTHIGPTGIELSVELGVRNPNKVALSARSVTAHVVLDGQVDLGTSTFAQPLAIPANGEIALTAPMMVQWKDLTTLTALALSNRDIPYAVDGVVTVGGEKLNVDLPYRLSGAITQNDLTAAAMRALPGLLPAP